MDEDDGDLPEPVGAQRDELVLRADLEDGPEEALQLPLPDRRLLEPPGERRRRLLLERDRAPRDHHRVGLRLGIEVEGSLHASAVELLAGVVDPQQRGGHDLDPRRDDVADLLVLAGGNDARRQGRADAGPAESDLEPIDPELGHRNEVGQLPARPAKPLLVERHLELAPRQLVRPRAHLHHGAVGRGEPERDAPVVQIGGHPKTRVEGIRRARASPPGRGRSTRTRRRRDSTRTCRSARHGRNDSSAVAGNTYGTAAPGEDVLADGVPSGRFRIVVEPLGQAVEEQDIPGGSAELARGQDVAGQLPLDLLRIDPHGANRHGARPGSERHREDEQHDGKPATDHRSHR